MPFGWHTEVLALKRRFTEKSWMAGTSPAMTFLGMIIIDTRVMTTLVAVIHVFLDHRQPRMIALKTSGKPKNNQLPSISSRSNSSASHSSSACINATWVSVKRRLIALKRVASLA